MGIYIDFLFFTRCNLVYIYYFYEREIFMLVACLTILWMVVLFIVDYFIPAVASYLFFSTGAVLLLGLLILFAHAFRTYSDSSIIRMKIKEVSITILSYAFFGAYASLLVFAIVHFVISI